MARSRPINMPNSLMDELARSKPVVSFRKKTRDVLSEQWDDIVTSGVVKDIYDEFSGIFAQRNEVAKGNREAINREILSGKVASYTKLFKYVRDSVTLKMQKLGKYGYDSTVKSYLYTIMNKGGQAELDKFLTPGSVTFRLSKEFYRQKIRDRARELIKGLEETTKDSIAKQLILGMDKGESKRQLVQRLMKVGKDISYVRANRIVETETLAAVEYMRAETAKANGAEYKYWHAVLDERTAPKDRELGEEDKWYKMDEPFEGGIWIPPLHINCRCHIEYMYSVDNPESYGKGAPSETYSNVSLIHSRITNRENVWAGGKSNVGKDVKPLKELRQRVSELGGSELYSDIDRVLSKKLGSRGTVFWLIMGYLERKLSTEEILTALESDYSFSLAILNLDFEDSAELSKLFQEYLASFNRDKVRLLIRARLVLTELGYRQFLEELKN